VQAQPVDFEIASTALCVVILCGEHDMSTRVSVSLTMSRAVDYPYVLVDLTKCTFVDSMLVGAITKGAARARERGGRLELAVSPGRDAVRRNLEIMGIDGRLRFHDSRADGIASLSQAERPTTTFQL
jgi:anti-anti-sigma regulatory factor